MQKLQKTRQLLLINTHENIWTWLQMLILTMINRENQNVKILLLEKDTANPWTKTRMYNSLQKIACVINVINTACNQQRQTQMAQEHAEFILEQKTKYGKQDTQGLPRTKRSKIFIDRKGISRFRMKRTKSVRVVQHSRTLLRGWRANCDIKLLLYYSNPNCPDISEIQDVSRYVVSYTGKRHNTSQAEIDAIQNIIMKWVKTWHNFQILNYMYNSPHINEHIIQFLNYTYHLTQNTFTITWNEQNTRR